MENPETKSKSSRLRIEVKVSAEQKDLFERAATLAKQGVSEFVRSAAEKAARDLTGKSSR
jgi:uncharacterized protein (DUF1778 family)